MSSGRRTSFALQAVAKEEELKNALEWVDCEIGLAKLVCNVWN